MKMNRLAPGALKLWYIRSGIVSLVLLGIFLPAALLVPQGAARTAVLLLGGIPLLIALALILVLPYFRYQLYSYGFDEKRIVVRHGVIFRHQVVIPICQIQDLHRFQGPVMMLLHLGGVTISTAGSNFDLACLTAEDADAMIDALEALLEKRMEEKADEEIQ